ncbi:uncharacterized protein LODBEIA_P57970 [Lodderomyces beijingensis]|uniref:Oxidoreductase n=1 Tax=Lodderomyces beijingensis TaxID=1775926 RepID=A0ABP0ZTU9_9ASCO
MIAATSLNVIVIGAGLIGPRHARHVNLNPTTTLYAIIDPQESTTETASSLETRHFYSIDECVHHAQQNGTAIDAAIICTPNHTHVAIAQQLASMGIHLLVEKPVATSIKEAQVLQQAVAKSGVCVLVGHHRRFNPYVLSLKHNLSKVGRIVAVQGSWCLQKPQTYFDLGHWRKSTRAGGGALLINLIHDLDILQFLFGAITRVYAEPLPRQRDHEADEGAALNLRFKNGVVGTFICADNVVSPFNFEAATGENPTVPKHAGLAGLYQVFGSRGTLSFPDMKLYHQDEAVVSSWTNQVEETKLEVVDEDELPFSLQLEHFVDVVRGRAKPMCGIDDGVSALRCIEAVMKSIQEEVPVNTEF